MLQPSGRRSATNGFVVKFVCFTAMVSWLFLGPRQPLSHLALDFLVNFHQKRCRLSDQRVGRQPPEACRATQIFLVDWAHAVMLLIA
jgi:hypothetical protein